MTNDLHVTDGPVREIRAARETARGSAYGAVSRRRFEASIEQVWPLLSDPERMREWSPDQVSGDFRLGGEFSVKDNASGQVLRCEARVGYRVSWCYEDNYSELEVRLGAVGDRATVVEIEHFMTAEDLTAAGMSVSEGLVAGGTGWDLALHYLGRHLRGELVAPPTANGDWEPSPEDLELYRQNEQAWRQVADESPAAQQ